MRRIASALLVLAAGAAEAQQWNDPRALTLARQATARRVQQLADSGLVDYQATAHGYVTFLAQLGEGFREPPRVVKADELALEVYWRAPNLSKQRIVGRRDTTLLPTDIQYHRDHLGIIQNNFPAIIRLGDGDEVQDVPHPLSPSGLEEYDFAVSDSLRISSPGRVINVYELKVRPRDDRQPRVIGAVYLDRESAQVVRMALSFTRAAFLDRQLEDLFVVLENGIVGGQFWLPRRQEIEIRRTATWLDYPARGIIRGRWEIGDYRLNTNVPVATFTGPEIVTAPPEVRAAHQWPGARILDSLPPDVRAVTAEEVRRVQAEARELVREQALRRARGSALAVRGVSDLIRFNRVEGTAFGAGMSWRFPKGVQAGARARYGMADRDAKIEASVGWENAGGTEVRAWYSSDFVEAGDAQERSVLVNSIAGQEAGSDFTSPVGVERIGAGLAATRGPTQWSLSVSRERHRPLAVLAVPASGRFEPVLSAARLAAWRGTLRMSRATALGWFGTEYRASAEARLTSPDLGDISCGAGTCTVGQSLRAAVTFDADRPVGDALVRLRSFAAAVDATGALAAQDLVFLGGPVSAPGYEFHELAGDIGLSHRAELQLPVPFPGLRLGRFGRSPARATLAPHAGTAWIRQVHGSVTIAHSGAPVPDLFRRRPGGLYPWAGVSLITAFDLLRFDVSRGLRGGRWAFTVDVTRPFWSIM